MRSPRCSIATTAARPANGCRTSTAGARTSKRSTSCAHLNAVVAERCPGAMMIAEESTAWPGRHAAGLRAGGLGFSYKWNMGWMHDTLHYIERDPVHRALSSRRDDLRPALRLLRELHPAAVARRGRARQGLADRQDAGRPLAEVRQPARLSRLHVGASRQEAAVHGRRVRARSSEWNHDAELDWHLLGDPRARRRAAAGARPQPPLPRASPRCTQLDCDGRGLRLDRSATTARNSVFAFLRRGGGRTPRRCWSSAISRRCRATAIGSACRAPGSGARSLNTDSALYGGSNVGNDGRGAAPSSSAGARRARSRSRSTLPPLATRDAAARGLMHGRLSGPRSRRDRPIRWARPGTGSAPISRCSRRMPSASSSACSIRRGEREIARLRAAGMHRRGLARLSAGRAGRACSTAIAPTAPMSRSAAIASIRTSCCSIPMRGALAGELRMVRRAVRLSGRLAARRPLASTGATARPAC